MVFRGHVALHALSVASAALVNVPAGGVAADERNRADLRRVADEVHRVLWRRLVNYSIIRGCLRVRGRECASVRVYVCVAADERNRVDLRRLMCVVHV